MTTPSPSEFLTFYRRIAAPSTLRAATRTTARSSTTFRPVQTTYTRTFSLSTSTSKDLSTDSSVKTDKYPDDKHATSKAASGDAHDPQSQNLKAGINAHKSGTGGHATEGKDSSNGKGNATSEAPDPAIGMQDERGGRGGGEIGKPK